MRRYYCFFIYIGIISGLLLGLTALVKGETTDQDKIQQLIERTKQEITKRKKQEKSVLTNLVKQQQELNKLEHNYQQLHSKLSNVRTKVDLTKQEQRKLIRNLGTLEKKLSRRQQLMNRRLVAVYKYGPQNYVEVLFKADSFTDLITRFSTVAYFVKNDLNSIAVVQETREEVSIKQQQVQQKKREIETELQKIVILQDRVKQAQENVVTKVQSTRKELNRIQSNRAQLEKALEEYEQTSREIEAQIRSNEQRGPGEIVGTGTMIWPLTGRLSSGFGWRYHPVLRRKKYHNGQDIAVPIGTSVRAADNGIVVVSGWKGGYGYFVAIDHGGGISTCYGHNSRLLVQKGERVTKGQVISLSGNTGLSTGPHLHFEVRRNGVPINPIPFLP